MKMNNCVCVCVFRVTLVVLWSVSKITSGLWWELSHGEAADAPPALPPSTPVSQSSAPGSTRFWLPTKWTEDDVQGPATPDPTP